MLHALESQHNDEALAYFYCDRNQLDRQDSTSIIRSFVRQLSTARDGSTIQVSVVRTYHAKKQMGFATGKLNMEECGDLLLHLVNVYPQTTLILDGLDECIDNQEIIKALDRVLRKSLRPLKIFVSSRPDEDIRERFEKGSNVSIQATNNQSDIASFVAAKIGEDDKSRRNRLSSELKEDIVSAILEESKGM